MISPRVPKSWRTVVSGGNEVAGLGHVVEADHADVLRDAQPALAQRGQQADGHVVVADEDRDAGLDVQLGAEAVPAGRGPVADLGHRDLEAVRGQLVAPAAGPLDRVERGPRSGEVQDAGVPQLGQVAYG